MPNKQAKKEQRIVVRIRLKSFDYRMLEQASHDIVNTIKRTGVEMSGPIPLPTKRRRYTVLISPHVNKDAREQFEVAIHARVLDLVDPDPSTVDALMKLNLSSGVNVKIVVNRTEGV